MFSFIKLALVSAFLLAPALAAPLEARACTFNCAKTDFNGGVLTVSTGPSTGAFTCTYQDSNYEKRAIRLAAQPPVHCSYGAGGALLTAGVVCPKSTETCATAPPPPPPTRPCTKGCLE